MNGAAVFLVAFFTSAATSVGTLYLAERLHLFQPESAPAAIVVPNLEGLPQPDAMPAIGTTVYSGLFSRVG